MYKIGILYICTGVYDVFWKEFFTSCEENLLRGNELHYYVFTDAKSVYGEENCPRIHRIYQENLGWPGNTLYRYHIFCKYKDMLSKMDYLFFMNANIVVKRPVTEEEFLPVRENLLFVRHPLFYNKPPYERTYERHRRSTAYIPFSKGTEYIVGGCNGGKTEDFFKMAETIKERTDIDDKHNIIAAWHDESHINRYLFDLQKQGKDNICKILSPSFCYPEGFDLPFEQVLVCRLKERYFNVTNIKEKPLTISQRIDVQMLRLRQNICKLWLNNKKG